MASRQPHDDVWRTRNVWLGPPGLTLPFHLPYAEYGVGLVVSVLFVVPTQLLLGWKWCGFALGAAILVTHLLFQFVNPDRPARQVALTVLTDWKRTPPRQAGPERPLRARVRFVDDGAGRPNR